MRRENTSKCHIEESSPYLGKNTVSTIVKSCKSKSLLGFSERLVMDCPMPSCMAAISSEVGFCPMQTYKKQTLQLEQPTARAYLGNITLSTTEKSCSRTSRSGLADKLPILCCIPNCMAAISSEVGFYESKLTNKIDKGNKWYIYTRNQI